MKPTDKEINELLNKLSEMIEQGRTRFRNMTYEQGLEAGIQWLRGDTDDHPYEVEE